MSSSADLDGARLTMQAIRMYHPEVADRISFLIVGNGPQRAADVEALDVPFRYVPFRGDRPGVARNLAISEADADLVCCIDSHVLLAPGALAALLAWFDEHPESRDLIHGPLLDDRLDRVARPADDPFEIGMHDLGFFACRRDAWPGLNPRFRGLGGAAGYLHEKVRRAGGRVVCHRAAGWAGPGARSGPASSGRASRADTVRNHCIGYDELGWDEARIDAHLAALSTGVADDDGALADAAREASNPFAFFDGIFCLNLDGATVRWSESARRHAQLGIAWHVERFPGIATPDNPHRGIAASFRGMVGEAKRRGYEHVLVLEDDAVFLDDAVAVMTAAVAELVDVEWDLCFLGACVWSQVFPFLGDSAVLQACGPVTCTHAVAVHARAYDRLLAEIPTSSDELDRFLREDYAIDQYLSRRIADGTYRAVITSPRVASQPNLLESGDGDAALAARYVT